MDANNVLEKIKSLVGIASTVEVKAAEAPAAEPAKETPAAEPEMKVEYATKADLEAVKDEFKNTMAQVLSVIEDQFKNMAPVENSATPVEEVEVKAAEVEPAVVAAPVEVKKEAARFVDVDATRADQTQSFVNKILFG